MKTYTLVLGLTLLFLSCGEAPKKDTAQQGEKNTEKEYDVTESSTSADYSTLLIDYNCDIDAAEIAKAMDIPPADIARTNSKDRVKKTFDLSETQVEKLNKLNKEKAKDNKECKFEIKGFGVDNFGNDMVISLHSTEMKKTDIKNEIKGYLRRKSDGLEKITKMYIEESDTKDSYIATALRYGRVIIYNENHNGAFLISYGINNANNNRTEEQHLALTKKVVNLANYLLQKHRK